MTNFENVPSVAVFSRILFMFDSEADSSGFSVGLCVLQLFGVPLICLMFGLLAGDVSNELLRAITKSSGAELLLGYVVFSLVGFELGYIVQTAIPRSHQSGGLWVWVLPVCILGHGVVDQLTRNPNRVIIDYFVFSPGNEGLGVALITWPALATCFYSVGVVSASRPATTALGAVFRRAALRSPLAKLSKIF